MSPALHLLLSLSLTWLVGTPWTVARQAPLSTGFPGKNTGVGCHSLLQGIFPTQGLNPGLLHCRWVHYPLSHQGNPSASVCCFFLSLLKHSVLLHPWVVLATQLHGASASLCSAHNSTVHLHHCVQHTTPGASASLCSAHNSTVHPHHCAQHTTPRCLRITVLSTQLHGASASLCSLLSAPGSCALNSCCCCSVAESCPTLCNPWTIAHQASLSFTISRSFLKLRSIELVMPSIFLKLRHINFTQGYLHIV